MSILFLTSVVLAAASITAVANKPGITDYEHNAQKINRN